MNNNVIKKGLFIVAILALVISVLYINLIKEPGLRAKLLSKGHYTIGIITEVYHPARHKQQSYPYFTYLVDGRKMEGYGNGIIQKQEDTYFNDRDIGRRFFVVFLPSDPEKCSILPYCIPPDTLQSPQKGWSKIPTGKIKYINGTADDE